MGARLNVTRLEDLFEQGATEPTYLEAVAAIHKVTLGAGLIALYLHGSPVQGDYRPGSSDLDVFGVVSGPIGARRCERLVEALKHESLPVPAFGLELILCTDDAVRQPVADTPFTFALSTGSEWGVQIETDGKTSDILVHMQLCRQAGIALFGPPAHDVVPPLQLETLREGLTGEMLWHRDDLQNNPSAEGVVNAVLNAARSLWAAEHGEVLSKTEGGEWWLTHHPKEQIVADALDFRKGRTGSPPDVESALDFVEMAIGRI